MLPQWPTLASLLLVPSASTALCPPVHVPCLSCRLLRGPEEALFPPPRSLLTPPCYSVLPEPRLPLGHAWPLIQPEGGLTSVSCSDARHCQSSETNRIFPPALGFFIRPFYKMMLGKQITLNDMESVVSKYGARPGIVGPRALQRGS